MIDEKKLIEDLLHNDGIRFELKLHDFTPEGVGTFLQEYTDKIKQGFVNLINAQPKYEWVNVLDRLPEKQGYYFCFRLNGFHVQKLYYIPRRGFYSGIGDLKKKDDVYLWADVIKPTKEGET